MAIIASSGAPVLTATRAQAYRFFLGALDSVGLTVERDGPIQRIAEIGAKPPRTAEIADPYVTVLVRFPDLSPEARERMLESHPVDICNGDFLAPPPDSLIITDHRSVIERLLGRPLPIP